MNDAHLHLAINHAPIIGGLMASIILGWGILRKSKPVVEIALALFIGLGIVSFGAQLTGEGAEKALEQSAQAYNYEMIEKHQAAAFPAHLAMLATAVASIVALAMRKVPKARFMPLVVLGFSLIAFGLMVRAGNLGSKITHQEAMPTNKGGAKALNGEEALAQPTTKTGETTRNNMKF